MLTEREKALLQAHMAQAAQRRDYSRETLQAEADKLGRYLAADPGNPKSPARQERLADITDTLAVLDKLGV